MKIHFWLHRGGRPISYRYRMQSRALAGGTWTRGIDAPPGQRQCAWEADRSISPQDVFRRDTAWLQCDHFIAAVSGFSFRLGFEIGYLLGSTNAKVVLLFRGEDAEQFIASSFGQFHNGQKER
jgi:hypothetical protein